MPPRKTTAADDNGEPAELLEALDAAMVSWATRKRMSAAALEAAIDRLHAAWAAGRELLERQAGSRRLGARPSRRADFARSAKARDDAERVSYIVRRYGQLIRKRVAPREARETIAAEIRSGAHVVAAAVDADGLAAHARTYSAGSVARVLRRLSGG